MKRRKFIQSASTAAVAMGLPVIGKSESQTHETTPAAAEPVRKVFAFGGGRDKNILRFMIQLTGKENPKIAFVPTATGDSIISVNSWYAYCEDTNIRPYVLRTFISSYDTKESFEETIMKMDAIYVGGGNTLNMLAIWKAHGIDASLRKAYEKGILMTGASAGSLCWFQSGTTDSRPKDLSQIECMGWLKGSHCPHYNVEEFRRPVYQDLIKKGVLPPGYACDNLSGVYFENEKMVKCVSFQEKARSYYVDLVNGSVSEKELPFELIK